MCDLLPQFVHEALDKVETSLSLPILVILAICTLQFAITHSMHIGCIVKDILRKRARKANRCPKPKPKPKCPKVSDGCGLMDRIKAIFNSWFNSKPKCPQKCPRKPKPVCKRTCPKKKCNKSGGDSDDDEFDDADDLLGLEDF